ncbi:VIT1/CCC1 transporter family protein [Gordonia jinhuaensis]|uniref:Membrane protein n=1 Tax=Gordonia jinhuaensis TaxID=1517702 RepID=A0A916WU73_9ACTN|nr:VIT1/CCC1 transporter family protein [Gordonia jinhuaensis]GGB33034.1 membrane protein [Gordonia jinhuaensis]
MVHASDGVVTVAGVTEGIATAGGGRMVILAAALSALVTGVITIVSGEYTEITSERDLNAAQLARERRQILDDPEGELDELTQIYQSKGLTPDVARVVAEQLTARDALAAHAEAELDIDELPATLHFVASAAVAFMLGGALPLTGMMLTSASTRSDVNIVITLTALAVIAAVGARLTGYDVRRGVVRAVLIGGVTMGLTYLLGSLVTF